jgi:hypothetical protein
MKRLTFGTALIPMFLVSLMASRVAAQRGSSHIGHAGPSSPHAGTPHSSTPRMPSQRSIPPPVMLSQPYPLISALPSTPILPSPAPSLFNATPRTYRPRRGSSFSTGGYALPFYGSVAEPDVTSAAPAVADPSFSGFLFLEVEPASAQILVDGVPLGAVRDFRRFGLSLRVGPHRVELRAPGFDASTFEVNIVAGLPTRYHGDLPRVQQAVAAPAHPPETFYVIPGCYMGNQPPRERLLPPGCDIARAKAINGVR